jgi:hypothetical protein
MSGGNSGTPALGLSMAFAKGEGLVAWQATFGKSKKNKEKIRD